MTESMPASRTWIPALSEVLVLLATGMAALSGDLAIAASGLFLLTLTVGLRVAAVRHSSLDPVRGLEAGAALTLGVLLGAGAAIEGNWRLLPAALLAFSGAGFIAGSTRLFSRLRSRFEMAFRQFLTPRLLSSLESIDTLVLNKTGTLTFGRLEVNRVSPMAGVTEEDLLETIVTAQQQKPADEVSRSIAELAAGRGISARTEAAAECLAGPRDELEALGIKLPRAGYAREGTTIWAARGGRCAGSVAVDDVLRPEVRHAIALFHGMKLRTVMLSEDDISSTRYIGWRSSVSASYGNLSAEDRKAKVTEIRSAGQKVAVIGDQSSDSALLGMADLAILMEDVPRGGGERLTLKEKNLLSLAEAFGAIRSFRLGTRLLAGAALLLGICGGLLVLGQQVPPLIGPVWGILGSGLLAWAAGLSRS